MRPLKTIGKDSLVYLPSTIVPAIVSFISLPIFTRLFPPADFGNYSIAMTTISLLTALFTGWLGQSALRFYEESFNQNTLKLYHSSLFITLFITILISVVISFCLLVFLKDSLEPQLYYLLFISILCYVGNGAYKVYAFILRAAKLSVLYSSAEVFIAIFKILIAIGIIYYFGTGTEGILWGFLIANILVIIPIIKKLKLHKYISLKNFSLSWSKTIFTFGYPISLALISTWLLSLVNRYIIGIMRGSAEVGLYSVSSTLSEKPLTLLFSGVMLAAYPVIISVWEQEGKQASILLINKLLRYYVIIFAPVIVMLSMFSKEIIRIISTEKYIAGHIVVPFIATGVFFWGLSQYMSKGFELSKKTARLALFMLAGGLLNLLLCPILVYFWGFLGAGISSMISYSFIFYLLKTKVRTQLALSFSYKTLFRIILSSILTIFLMIFIKGILAINLISLILITVGYFFVYLTLLYFLGEFDSKEKKTIKKFLLSKVSIKQG